MDLKVKVGPIGVFDMLKFKNMAKTRNAAIAKASAKDVDGYFPINEKAKLLHPDVQKMKITDIIDHKSAASKTFTFSRVDGKKAAGFRAGQYLSVSLKIGNSVVTRPYSICSSPKDVAEGKYQITVRTNPNGFVAEHLLANAKVGDEVLVSEGLGNFYYEDLRDSKNVVALAGGSGITPFLAMARAIKDGIEDFNLTIIFGSRTKDGILFQKELDEISKACSKIKVVHVLSDEKLDGFENGFISADLIKKYAPKEGYSVFICGPEAMYRFLEKEVDKLGLPKKFIRREMLGVTKKVWEQKGYPAAAKDKTFKVTVKQCGTEKTIDASANEPILVAIERAGITAPSRCRSGECGWCRSKILKGTTFTPEENDYRRWADKQSEYVHPCSAFATSDIVIEVPGSYAK